MDGSDGCTTMGTVPLKMVKVINICVFHLTQ